ncbi:Nif3-like dinuclear metal center hexameric protein [Halomonas vilamensis]|uniref:Nif3-like dinuclear metal center hexameric protein n=1 Tax=Vreelandella vilamensis TaxID=531309 RepID=A0ABU1H2K4_9GAMM|nr:Nif3-like dinuclear metal center hexameric protein [Halomonas vilamensis]MDR5898086.1 Nif3-like dinuclear metal center hexameric protein [Halomonas vilamensis]
MVKRDVLVAACENKLSANRFNDFTLNGLQVEGRGHVQRVLTGVTACQALLDEAVAWEADAVVVHHGFFWKNEPVALTGMKQRRIKTLLSHDINLLAYHLPLDAHPELGNNAQLAKRMRWQFENCLDGELGEGLLWQGKTAPTSLAALSQRVGHELKREPLVIDAGIGDIERVAWCTGGAQDMIAQAYKGRAQLFLSGEISERTTHLAREMGIHYIAAGHHATERYGVQALGEWLAAECGIEHRFVDIDNPA